MIAASLWLWEGASGKRLRDLPLCSRVLSAVLRGEMATALVVFIVLNLLLGPPVVRLPLIDWTYHDGHATAGWTVWPLFVALDAGPMGDAVREHEMLHWRHPFWNERRVEEMYPAPTP